MEQGAGVKTPAPMVLSKIDFTVNRHGLELGSWGRGDPATLLRVDSVKIAQAQAVIRVMVTP